MTTSSEGSTTGGGHRAAALVVLVVSYGAAAIASLLYLLVRPAWTSDQWYFVVDLADGLVYAAVAWVLLSRVRHPVAWLVALTAIGGSLAALGFQWFQFSMSEPGVPELARLSHLQNTAWIPGTLALVTVVPWLVRDDPLDRFARLAVGAGVAVIGWWLVLRLTDPFPWPDGDAFAPLPIRDEAWGRFIERAFRWQVVALVVLGLVASADALRRWATRSSERRRGFGWLAVGSFLVTISFVPLALPEDVAERLPVAFTPLMHLGSQLFFPAAILVVVLGQRLWGIDLAVSRAVSWALLTAVLTIGYVAVVSLSSALAPGESGVQQVVATACVAAGFQPVKAWVQRRVDHLVHGDATEPLTVVRRVGQQVGGGSDPDELLDDVAAGVASSLRLGGVAIVLGEGESSRTLASVGTVHGSAATTTEIALAVREHDAGRLLVTPRHGERLDARTLRSLDALAPIIAATVQLSGMTDELARSRSALEQARADERGRLRRELHDGLGPALAGIGLALQASRNLIASDPNTAGRLIEEMVLETDRRVEEVRTMARELLPPTLEGDGLVPALRDLVALHRAAGIRIGLEVGAVDEPTSAGATAAYAIVSEAVRNVVRHADAGSCTITVDMATDDELRISVEDDGLGIDAASPPGVGLTSMREWADGVGGTLTVERRDPGTRVVAVIPTRDGGAG